MNISALRQQELRNIRMSVHCCTVQYCAVLHEVYNQMQKYTSFSLVCQYD